jgi:heme-degrading monooxygenase HmoA
MPAGALRAAARRRPTDPSSRPTQAENPMILEVATLDVIAGQEARFQADFDRAQAIIASMNGYIGHQLQRCIETPSRYILLVRWETLKDHTEGFRGSPRYQEWKDLLHHYYDPFPTVEHYEPVFSSPDA